MDNIYVHKMHESLLNKSFFASDYNFLISEDGVIVNNSPLKYVINYDSYNDYYLTIRISDNGTIPLTTECIVVVAMVITQEGR